MSLNPKPTIMVTGLLLSSKTRKTLASVGALARTEKLYSLDNDRFVRVDKRIIARYKELVEKYFNR